MRDDTVYLNGLIKKANEGRKALEELFRLVPDKMEIKSQEDSWDSRKAGQWGPLKSIRRLEYRVKPKKTFPSWKTQNGHHISEAPYGDISIGCKNYDFNGLKNVLHTLCMTDANSCESYGVLGWACKRGITNEDGILYWCDAQKLYEILKEIKR